MSIFTDFPDNELGNLIDQNADKLFESVKGISTGFPELDKFTRGLLPGHLLLIASETGVGKTVFAMNILVHLALSGSAKSLYLDLENGAMATGKRILMIAGNKTSEFFDDGDNHSEVSKITATFKDKIFYYDRLSLEPYLKDKTSLALAEVLGAMIEDFVIKRDIKVVVIDPLEEFELLTADPSAGYTAIQQVVSLFRDLAQKYLITIILIHHLKKPSSDSKQVKNLNEDVTPKYRIPTIHDVMGSSKIVNVCTDVWCFVRQIHAPDEFEQGKTLFRILKARETRLGDVRFQMDIHTLKFHGETFAEQSTRETNTEAARKAQEKAEKIAREDRENKRQTEELKKAKYEAHLAGMKQGTGIKKELDRIEEMTKQAMQRPEDNSLIQQESFGEIL